MLTGGSIAHPRCSLGGGLPVLSGGVPVDSSSRSGRTARRVEQAAPELAPAVPPGRLALCLVGGGQDGERLATAFAEGVTLGSYSSPRSGIGQAPPAPLRRVEVVGRVRQVDLDLGFTRADATVLARDLANTPSSTKGPSWVAGRARRDAAEVGLTCRVRDQKDLAAEGFGGLLAVGAAAAVVDADLAGGGVGVAGRPSGNAAAVVVIGAGGKHRRKVGTGVQGHRVEGLDVGAHRDIEAGRK